MAYAAAVAMVVTAVAAAGSAYMQYDAAKQTAATGKMQAEMKRSQLRTERDSLVLQTQQREVERRKRLSVVESTGRAMASAMGIDAEGSGSLQALDTANQRDAEIDVGSIRLFGANRAAGLMYQDFGAQMELGGYETLGRQAWIRPSLQLMQSGADAYKAFGR